ncbi:MAG: alpha-mannosidase [Clostridia bacterium]|nr:alpha-mannosidase [Clostridia bacterium]
MDSIKKQKVYMIGNAHLDPSWVWSWQEGSCEAKATIRSALDRMKEYPDFKFVCSSASVYQWVEDFDSEMFAEVKERVKEGRFIIVGGWKVQPDCNLPCGENFARQSLYSQRYFQKTFGKMAKVGYNVDSFGHNAMMPQILRQSGMKYYVFMRPMQHEKQMTDNIFAWEAPDGSRVIAFRINETYCKNFTDMEQLENYLGDCTSFYRNQEFMGYYGVGNHGGGPTIQNIELIKEYNERVDGKYELIMADPVEFFEKYEKENILPVVKEELQHHASGCYSAVSEIKMLLRKGETKLMESERFSVLANVLLNKRYDCQKIQNAWENLNFLSFHDILDGCCIKSAYADSLYMGQESISLAEKQKNSALQTLSWKIDTTNKEYGLPIVIFNSHPFDVEETVEINNSATSIKDAQGNAVPFVNIPSEANYVYGRDNAIFRAKIPALGYSIYYYTTEKRRTPREKLSSLTMENEYLRVRFDKRGRLVSLFDKKGNRESLSGAGRCVVIDETSHDTWSHAKNYFDKEIGEFKVKKIKKILENELREEIKVVSVYGASTLTQYYTLDKGDDILRVRVKLDWQEKHKMLKFALPIQCKTPTSVYEIPFGTVERPCNGEEEPALTWGMVGDEENGLAILNDGKYSYSAKENVFCLSAIRSPIYCDHGWGRDEEALYTDQGIHEFGYALMPTTTSQKAKIFCRATAFNVKPTVILENHHKGTLPLFYRGINVQAENVLISALKQAEDGHGFVLRAYECEGKETKTRISWTGVSEIKAHFRPYEIKTFLIDGKEIEEVLFTEYKE